MVIYAGSLKKAFEEIAEREPASDFDSPLAKKTNSRNRSKLIPAIASKYFSFEYCLALSKIF